ncbi:MAG: hypothetical protein ACREIE_00580 [Nitrospiraceae bacterium]
MATICATPFKVPRLRATLLDSCGVPVQGSCSTVVTDGTITVTISREYEDREDFFTKNGDGVFCVKETTAPILKWINVEMEFCNVDPQLVNFIAGEAVLLDDATIPNIIGFRNTEGASAAVNVALEVWTRTAGTSPAGCGPGQTRFGYMLFPWAIEGTIADLTLENGNASFTMMARTRSGSPWGVGPYTVVESALPATLGNPEALFSPVGSLDHELWLWTTLQPPVAACGCIALPLPLVAADTGVLTATVTIPAGTLPVFIDWGDGMTQTVTVGPTVMHVYAAPATYLIQLWPADVSSSPYSISLLVT